MNVGEGDSDVDDLQLTQNIPEHDNKSPKYEGPQSNTDVLLTDAYRLRDGEVNVEGEHLVVVRKPVRAGVKRSVWTMFDAINGTVPDAPVL